MDQNIQNNTPFAGGLGSMQFSADKRPDRRDLLKKRRTNPPQNGKSGKSGWPMGHRIAFVILLIMLGLFLWKQVDSTTANYAKITYTEFVQLMNSEIIESARLRNGTLFGDLSEPTMLGEGEDRARGTGIEVQIGPYDQAFVQELVEKGVDVRIAPERTWMNILISTLPWILIFGIWLFILRQMQGGPKGVFTFGKSRAKLMTESQTKVTFADVAGVEEAKQELEEIIEFLKDPRKFQRLGGKIPKGALLIGPPGTGKTLLARAVAGEAGVPFFSMSGSDFVEMFVGVGASRVRDLFEQGKSSAPCIIFIDEIDAVGRQRGAGIGGGHDEREQTLNQLLVEMDGFESNEGVILLAATNRPDVLDPALLRPGRFDRQIIVDWPDVKARENILQVHVKKIQVSNKVDLSSIAKGTPGLTGADLANVVNEAALHAARINRDKVTMPDFEEAKDKIMMGTARKALVITDEEKTLTAYHEAGHVLVSKFMPDSDPVHKVSIVARGRALGLTHFLPADEKHNWSYNYCMSKLAILLGGRAAEMIKFGDITNGASNDIENATRLARKMVCEWGMSKRLGPLSFGQKEHEVFLGREIQTHKDYSEQTSEAIDQEIRKYVESALQKAESIIRDNTDSLEALTQELLRKEVLAGNEIDRIVSGNGDQQSPRKSTSRRRRRRPSRKPAGDSPATTPQQDAPEAKSSGNDDNKDATEEKSKTGASSGNRRRPSGNRRRRPSSTQGKSPDSEKTAKNTDNSPRATDGSSKKAENKKDLSKKDASNGTVKKQDGEDSNGSSGKRRNSRTRMVRLKTGGRQRTIRKVTAKKIRKIN